jgi:hypothetical protein
MYGNVDFLYLSVGYYVFSIKVYLGLCLSIWSLTILLGCLLSLKILHATDGEE